MFRRALLYILILATISMVCFVVFIQGQDVCAELFVETTEAEGAQILQFVGMPQGKAVVLGQYTQGVHAGDIFSRIYFPGGSDPVESHLGMDGASVTLQQVVPAGEEIHLICLVTPRAQDTVSYGAVYVLDKNGAVQEPVCYKESGKEAQYGFNRFVCANSNGQVYAGIQNQRVTVFNKQGEPILQLNSEQTREIYDVRYGNTGVLITGCTSESGIKETVHRGFCAFYDLEGNRVWRKAVVGEEGVKAAVVRILDDGQDGWILYGQYGVEDFSQMETQGILFRFEEGQAKGNHTFLIGVDKEGQLTRQITYTETSPYLVSQNLSGESGLLLRAYTAKRVGADRYKVQMVRLDRDLEEISRGEIPVWGDQMFYCAPWAENGQEGIWIYHAGEVRFYENEQAISRHFTQLMKWRPVCEAALSMGTGAPWFLCLYGMMTLCTLGIARSPHSRHYGAFCRKKRHV